MLWIHNFFLLLLLFWGGGGRSSSLPPSHITILQKVECCTVKPGEHKSLFRLLTEFSDMAAAKLLFFHWRMSVIAFLHIFLLQLFPNFHLCGNIFLVGFERSFCRQLGKPQGSLWRPGLCSRNNAILGLIRGLTLRQSKDWGALPLKNLDYKRRVVMCWEGSRSGKSI